MSSPVVESGQGGAEEPKWSRSAEKQPGDRKGGENGAGEEGRARADALPQEAGDEAGGDPSPMTAIGVFQGIEAAARFRLGADSVKGLRVAVQGVGHVGIHLCRLLHEAGAELVVADVNRENLKLASDEMPVTIVAPAEVDEKLTARESDPPPRVWRVSRPRGSCGPG